MASLLDVEAQLCGGAADAPTACPLETADQSSVLGSAEQDAFDENSNVPFHKSKKTGTLKKYYKKYFKPTASENKPPTAGGGAQPPSPTAAAPPATSQLSHASSMQDDPYSEVTSEIGRGSRQSHRPTAEREGEGETQDLRGTLKGMFHKKKPSKHYIELDAIRQAHVCSSPKSVAAQQQRQQVTAPPLASHYCHAAHVHKSIPTSTIILSCTWIAHLKEAAAQHQLGCVPLLLAEPLYLASPSAWTRLFCCRLEMEMLSERCHAAEADLSTASHDVTSLRQEREQLQQQVGPTPHMGPAVRTCMAALASVAAE
jgi:hypothetical protein